MFDPSSHNISKDVGFQRLGIHRLTLKPGERTSLPHAESHEEEFVYVLSGEPHAWIDGWLYGLKPGHACGFPAGTGIGHCFINNTQENIELLVVGERTKPENKCVYLKDPEEHQKSKIRWDDYPHRELGPHSGKPGVEEALRVGVIMDQMPPMIVHAPSLPLEKSFHYPGDNETFGVGPRLSNPLGLVKLGISYDVIPAGHRSSFPHAHTVEEEFVMVLQGNGTAWANGQLTEMEPGEWMGFDPKKMVAHCVINDSDEPLALLVVGEASEFPGEQIAYPQNPLRNKECDRIGWFWRDFEMKNPGAHSGRPQKKFSGHLRFHLATEDHVNQVLGIFEKSPDYFLNVEGQLPSAPTALHSILDGPQKQVPEYYKEFLMIEFDGALVGTIDLHLNHPEVGIAYLGLLLLDDRFQGLGLGRKSYQLLEDYARRAHRCRHLRLGVSKDNDMTSFWQKMGFAPNGRSYQWQGEGKTSTVIEFEKAL